MPASNAGTRGRVCGALLATICACSLLCGPAFAEEKLAAALDDRFTRREAALSGLVEESVEASLLQAGASVGLSRELADALSSALDGREAESGDMFYVRYEKTVAPDGREVGAGRIVSAEFMTAVRGRIAFYRFRPKRGGEQLWLASGESLVPPAMRLPLDTVSISSAFGVRADPFEQPRHGLGAPSRVGAVGATINTATARGIALGLAPGPGRSVNRGRAAGAAFVMHNGIDLAASPGTPILAASDGTVVGAAPNAGYGNWVRIQHADNVATVYGHLSEFAAGLSAGVKVRRGQVIGFVGNTGRSTGPHLHFEVIRNGGAVDPLAFPAARRAKLAGADLESFRKLVRQSEATRHGETAFLLISAGGVH